MGNKNSTSIPNENTELLPSEDQHGAGRELLPSEDQHGAGRELANQTDTADRKFEDQSGIGKGEHCMVCRKSKKIKDFDELEPGDHIEVPMYCKKWSPFKHHAIVEDVRKSDDDVHIAQVKVIDVPSSGKKVCTNGAMYQSGDLKVKLHFLGVKDKDKDVVKDKEDGKYQDKDKDKDINCKKFTIKKVEYHRRRNTHEQTLDNARRYVSKDLNMKYHVCVRNCEHFCVAMVNQDTRGAPKDAHDAVNNAHDAPKDAHDAVNNAHDAPKNAQNASKDKEPQSIENATCLQSARIFWVTFHCVLYLIQYPLFVFNFQLYAVYAKANARYNHVFGNTSSNPLRFCFTGSKCWGISTYCDWLVLAGFLLFYILGYVYLLRKQHKKRDMCRQCLISARIVFITKIICFAALEIINIFSERYLYSITEKLPQEFTWLIVFLVGSAELFVVLFIAPKIFVKLMICCILKCCTCPSKCSQCCYAVCCYPWEFDKKSHEYVIHYA